MAITKSNKIPHYLKFYIAHRYFPHVHYGIFYCINFHCCHHYGLFQSSTNLSTIYLIYTISHFALYKDRLIKSSGIHFQCIMLIQTMELFKHVCIIPVLWQRIIEQNICCEKLIYVIKVLKLGCQKFRFYRVDRMSSE